MSTAVRTERRPRAPRLALQKRSSIEPAAARAVGRAEWTLRLGASACFIGHGAFGLLRKEAWVPYFAVIGIDRDLAAVLMPIVGTIDIAAGILVLVSPRPIVLLYMVAWGLWTAFLRPLAGESFFEMLERAGNYGVPFALLVVSGVGRSPRHWLSSYGTSRPRVDRLLLDRLLVWTTATLLFAHGALQSITRKASFEPLYAAIGVVPETIPIIGWLEMTLAALLVIAPMPALLIAIAMWKLATEALFPMSGAPIWEFVERGGSYAAPIALVLLHGHSPFTRINLSRSTR